MPYKDVRRTLFAKAARFFRTAALRQPHSFNFGDQVSDTTVSAWKEKYGNSTWDIGALYTPSQLPSYALMRQLFCRRSLKCHNSFHIFFRLRPKRHFDPVMPLSEEIIRWFHHVSAETGFFLSQ